jgi:putative endonuclease
MAWVYILRELPEGSFYIGSTTSIERRMQEHENGKTYTTQKFKDFELAFKQEYATVQEARVIERKLKKLKRKDYISKIIADGFIKMRV